MQVCVNEEELEPEFRSGETPKQWEPDERFLEGNPVTVTPLVLLDIKDGSNGKTQDPMEDLEKILVLFYSI